MSDNPYIAVMRDEAVNGPRGKRESYLDEKLRNIPLATLTKDNGSIWLTDKDITTIKQAFTDAGYSKTDSLLSRVIEMSGNEFAMGYDDSGCFWHFHGGVRGNGRMLFETDFESESPEIEEALSEYRDFIVNRAAKRALGLPQ